MTRNTIVPAIVCNFLLAAPALAQTYPDPIAALAHNDPPPAQMYEDIEIMRRLLDRKLGGLPDVHSVDYATFVKRLSLDLTGLPAKPSDYHHLVEQYKAHGLGGSFAEGVYLPGYGVVYTVSLQGHFGPLLSVAYTELTRTSIAIPCQRASGHRVPQIAYMRAGRGLCRNKHA